MQPNLSAGFSGAAQDVVAADACGPSQCVFCSFRVAYGAAEHSVVGPHRVDPDAMLVAYLLENTTSV